MDYSKILETYLDAETAAIIDDYIGLYCNICGRTFIKDFRVYSVHDGDYVYNQCMDTTQCILLEEKSKINPWRSIH